MVRVISSNLDAVGFNPATGQGRIDFKNGTSYLYEDCTAEEALAIATAESPGRTFLSTWRDSREYRRIH
jgi:hypothetical protein